VSQEGVALRLRHLLKEVTQGAIAGTCFKTGRDPEDPLEVQKSPSFTGKSRRLRENRFVYEKNEFSVRKIN
jgi:predicted TIM-barrel enzyme